MSDFSTKLGVGEDAFYLDPVVLAPVGPLPIIEVAIVSGFDVRGEIETVTTYKFRGSVSKRESDVFTTHEEAMAAAEAARGKSFGAIAPPTARQFHGVPGPAPVDAIGDESVRAIGHKRRT